MLRDEMLAVIADVNTQVAERDELVECIAIALLTQKNLFILHSSPKTSPYPPGSRHSPCRAKTA